MADRRNRRHLVLAGIVPILLIGLLPIGSISASADLTDLCPFEIELPGGECSHADPEGSFPHHSGAASLDAPLAPACDGDGQNGRRVQVLYARSQDKPDRYAQVVGSLRNYAGVADAIFLYSAQETGGYRRIRFVHAPSCGPVDVGNAVMPTGADVGFDTARTALRALGHNRTDRIYMVFLDAAPEPGFCGRGTRPNDDRPTANVANTGNRFGMTYSNCWGGETAAHELMHNLGGVQSTAPNSSGAGHCNDEWDRMCYDDEGPFGVMTVCAATTHDHRFDCNHDDYFNTDPSAGSYLATHWNTADNEFLIGTPGIRVRRSTGSSFSAETKWSNINFYGTRGNFVADVTGDGLADAVAWREDTLWVQIALASGGFGPPTQWADPVVAFDGTRGNFVADVTGDGLADAVAWREDTIWVRRSTGMSFAAPTQWSNPVAAFEGTRGNFVADVSGDGLADAVAWREDTIWVRQAQLLGGFGPPTQWSNPVAAFEGVRGNFVADVSGDHRADAVALN